MNQENLKPKRIIPPPPPPRPQNGNVGSKPNFSSPVNRAGINQNRSVNPTQNRVTQVQNKAASVAQVPPRRVPIPPKPIRENIVQGSAPVKNVTPVKETPIVKTVQPQVALVPKTPVEMGKRIEPAVKPAEEKIEKIEPKVDVADKKNELSIEQPALAEIEAKTPDESVTKQEKTVVKIKKEKPIKVKKEREPLTDQSKGILFGLLSSFCIFVGLIFLALWLTL